MGRTEDSVGGTPEEVMTVNVASAVLRSKAAR